MREIQDQELLDRYLKRYNIEALFNTPDLPFHLYEYDQGELMNVLHPTTEYLKFVVEGSFRGYSINSEGKYAFGAKAINAFYVQGDLEFCGFRNASHYDEVVEKVLTIELPLHTLRETLLNDNRFLRHLIHRIGTKLAAESHMLMRTSLEDSLLYYLRNMCPDHRITSVEDTALRLNYSRSQLQRVLRDLTSRGILEKQGKGAYQLKEA